MCGETGGNGEEGEEEEVVVGPMVGGKEGAKTISGHDDVILQTGDEGATRRGATTDMLVTNVASETVSSGGHGLCSLFYGWLVVVFAGLAIVLSFPGCSFGIAFFLPSLRSALDLSHTGIALVWGGGILIVAAMLPLVGYLVDRHGPWRVLLATTFPLSGCCFLMSQVSSWWTLMALLAGLRFFGVGTTYVCATKMASSWFVRKRGRVSVLIITLFYVQCFLPVPVHALILRFGWRDTYRVLSGIILGGLAMVLMIVRDRPASFGLFPDGDIAPVDTVIDAELNGGEPTIASAAVATTSLTAREALRTPIFLILCLAIFVVELYWCAVNFNIVALLGPSSPIAKLTDDEVLIIMTIMSVVAATSSLVTGAVVERLQRARLRKPGKKHRHGLMRLVALQMAFACASAVCLCYVNSFSSAVGWVMLFSMMIGVQDIIMLVAFSEIFGADHIGSIMGWVTLVMTLATSSGPVLGALAVDSGVTLRSLYFPCATIAVIVAVCCLLVPDPGPVYSKTQKLEMQ